MLVETRANAVTQKVNDQVVKNTENPEEVLFNNVKDNLRDTGPEEILNLYLEKPELYFTANIMSSPTDAQHFYKALAEFTGIESNHDNLRAMAKFFEELAYGDGKPDANGDGKTDIKDLVTVWKEGEYPLPKITEEKADEKPVNGDLRDTGPEELINQYLEKPELFFTNYVSPSPIQVQNFFKALTQITGVESNSENMEAMGRFFQDLAFTDKNPDLNGDGEINLKDLAQVWESGEYSSSDHKFV